MEIELHSLKNFTIFLIRLAPTNEYHIEFVIACE